MKLTRSASLWTAALTLIIAGGVGYLWFSLYSHSRGPGRPNTHQSISIRIDDLTARSDDLLAAARWMDGQREVLIQLKSEDRVLCELCVRQITRRSFHTDILLQSCPTDKATAMSWLNDLAAAASADGADQWKRRLLELVNGTRSPCRDGVVVCGTIGESAKSEVAIRCSPSGTGEWILQITFDVQN